MRSRAVARKIPEDLVDYLESGVSLLVGTRSKDLRPEAARACGAQVAKDREHLSIFIPAKWQTRTYADIEDNGLVSVGFSRMLDHYSIQIKGDAATVRAATEAERIIPERYRAAYVEQLYMGGLPRSLTTRFHVWPAKVVTFRVQDIFVQTPGPGAGAPLERK